MVVSPRVQGQGEDSVGLGIMRSHGPQGGVPVSDSLGHPPGCGTGYLFIHFELGLHVAQAGLKLTT